MPYLSEDSHVVRVLTSFDFSLHEPHRAYTLSANNRLPVGCPWHPVGCRQRFETGGVLGITDTGLSG